MKLRLKFHGPNTVAITNREAPLQLGHAVSFVTELIIDPPTVNDAMRFFEMERTFNELTKGRLHVELVEEKTS